MGHARSETFLKHYLSSSVIVDVQAAFLVLESRSDLIKEMGKLKLRRDPNLPKKLSDAQKKMAHREPDLMAAQQLHDDLSSQLKTKYRRINKAPPDCPDCNAHKQSARTLRKLKLHYERIAFQNLLDNSHSNADLEHMVMQLKEETPITQAMLPPLQHAIPDREWLANHLFSPADDTTFAQIVESMARLCFLIELVKGSSKQIVTTLDVHDHSEQHATGLVQSPIQSFTIPDLQSSVQNCASTIVSTITRMDATLNGFQSLSCANPSSETPMPATRRRRAKRRPGSILLARNATNSAGQKLDLPRKVCLFCYEPDIRNKYYSRPDNLRRHYRTTHFQYQIGLFPCPVLQCNDIIQDPDHFAAHATSTHRSGLGFRALIK